jgi:ribosomal protein S18 acetylase RimI-like enzyme
MSSSTSKPSAKKSDSSAVTIDRLAPKELRGALLDEIYAIYCAALEIDPDGERAAQWRDHTLPRHAKRNDFVFLVARERGELLGFAYGYTGAYGHWWTDHVAGAMDQPTRASWLDRPHFEVCELHVRPDRQRGGIGTRLLDTLLAAQPNGRALLTANPAKAQPIPFYRKHGWSELAEVSFGEGYPPYRVLGKEL